MLLKDLRSASGARRTGAFYQKSRRKARRSEDGTLVFIQNSVRAKKAPPEGRPPPGGLGGPLAYGKRERAPVC
jgi:hypothetical protein